VIISQENYLRVKRAMGNIHPLTLICGWAEV